MEHKRNEATLNRPEGDRVLDASYVFIDINEFTRQLREEPNIYGGTNSVIRL